MYQVLPEILSPDKSLILCCVCKCWTYVADLKVLWQEMPIVRE